MFFQFKRNWLIILLLIIILGIILIINQSNNTSTASDNKDDGLLLMCTLSEANVKNEKVILKFSGLVNTYEDISQIHSFKVELERAFSTNLSLTTQQDEKELIKYQGQKVVSSLPNSKIKVAQASVLKKNGNYQVYLIVSLLSYSIDQNGFSQNYDYLKNALENASVTPNIKVNIQGSVNQKLTHSGQKQKIMDMFNSLGASVSEGLNEKEVISLSGYSKKLSNSIKSDKYNMNIQIASRFDPLDGITTFTIGTPLITIEY
ncbi:YwmB family TATA-box binding protein [Virgibacillus oceani]|uniref:Membrane protein n=1 Tax=Virgibacillus oceani TaxID=1479511 RepID=A0A917GYW0_9BACI|nr:YwmB family TATA-box binding protein [Virgibacillus oceani]GGG60960.1 membrane protein [Virgibacillus oceani]